MTSTRIIFTATAAFAAATLVHAGPDWDEITDAGSLPISAQKLFGFGQISSISGKLSPALFAGGEADSQDMYLIRITEPTKITFSAATAPALGGFANFNSRLWLFSVDGLGLLANDDADDENDDDSSLLLDASDDGTGVVITQPGLYYLAITGTASAAIDDGQDELFLLASSSEISGPDGPGGANEIDGWTPASDTGDYVIALTGVSFVLPGDLNGDGVVDGADFGLLISSWGACAGCLADLDGDGVVGGSDLGILLGNWG